MILPTSDADLDKLARLEIGKYDYSVADFFTKPSTSSFHLSPNSDYLSYKKRNEQCKTDLWLKDTKTQEERLLIAEEKEVIRGYGWFNSILEKLPIEKIFFR